jgi:hypothetical protein
MELRVKVLESRPVIVDGTVRHRIQLHLIRTDAELEMTSTPIVSVESDARAEAV